jgi:RNA-binding protein
MPSLSLKNSQRRHLRGLAHALKPIIQVGNKGLTPSLLAEFGLALEHHELVKVKFSLEDRVARAAQVAELAKTAEAELVQSVGKMACYFRRSADQPRIELPK